METLITLAAVSGIAIVGYFSMLHQKNRNFKRYLKKGDPVNFFIGEERYYGIVHNVIENVVTIEFRGDLIYRNINDVYPCWGVRYKPAR